MTAIANVDRDPDKAVAIHLSIFLAGTTMDSIILHHYPPSLFSEKVRVLVFRPTLAVGHHSAHDASPPLDTAKRGLSKDAHYANRR